MIRDDEKLVTVDSGKILAGAEKVYWGFRSSFLRKQESSILKGLRAPAPCLKHAGTGFAGAAQNRDFSASG